ncbi:hypothetical protein DEAC_c43070 [Desulfosporosinus acididurans]|uniref:Chromosome partition protein Smc n=1 Tax=Desulfosporosinus acididurans TaxID=476652 RepID=A0A0J1FLG5_9FIRM|nr:hypothetical protein [Desulfosporosinus acididurans]KLU63778.1 hypothetical protein DEAC_c43070 [Desulfosporosinus acididurans]
MTKLSAKLIQLVEGMKMNNQPIQSEKSIRELNQGGNPDMNIQDQIDGLKHRFKELDNNCLNFISQYDNVIQNLEGVKYLLTIKSLEPEDRQQFEERFESLAKFQKDNYQEYKRVKGLRTKIQSMYRTIGTLIMDHDSVKRLKAQADRCRKELILVQQKVNDFDREYSNSLQKLEMKLEVLCKATQSDEFIIG